MQLILWKRLVECILPFFPSLPPHLPLHHRSATFLSSPPLLLGGRSYERNLTVPVLGNQHIKLYIHSPSRASIEMRGALTLEPETFPFRQKGHNMEFELGPRTCVLLSRVHTKMCDAQYDPATDTPSVVVKPPMIPAIRIQLHRSRSHKSRDSQHKRKLLSLRLADARVHWIW